MPFQVGVKKSQIMFKSDDVRAKEPCPTTELRLDDSESAVSRTQIDCPNCLAEKGIPVHVKRVCFIHVYCLIMGCRPRCTGRNEKSKEWIAKPLRIM